MTKTISIPRFVALGAYAEEHGDEICDFIEKLFQTKSKPAISDCDGFSDAVEVEFTMDWECDGEICELDEYVCLNGSTCGFKISGSFSLSKSDRKAFARWCIEHCGHWAYGEDDDDE